MANTQTLGARIAQARRELAVRLRRDLTQADVAQLVGTTAATMSRWESDLVVPKEAALMKLAKALSVTPAFLRYGVEGTQPSTSVTMTPEIVAGRGSPSEPIERKRRA